MCCVLSYFSHVQLFATLWIIVLQAPLNMGFSRQEYWSGLPFPSLGYCLNPGIRHAAVMYPGLSGRFFTTSITWKVNSDRVNQQFPIGLVWNLCFQRSDPFHISCPVYACTVVYSPFIPSVSAGSVLFLVLVTLLICGISLFSLSALLMLCEFY